MKVYVNVYDILKYNKYIDCLGIGIYHTGVEVNGSEYAYGGNALIETSGVYEMTPKDHDVFTFKQSIEVGEVESDKQVWAAVQKMMKKYRTNKYDMLKQNCNHFTNDFLILLLGRGLPSHLNRIANIGSYLHCVVPKRYLIVVPPGSDEKEVRERLKWDFVDSTNSIDNKSTQYDSRYSDSEQDSEEDSEDTKSFSDQDQFDLIQGEDSQDEKNGLFQSRASELARERRKNQKLRKASNIQKREKRSKHHKQRSCKDKLFGFLKIA